MTGFFRQTLEREVRFRYCKGDVILGYESDKALSQLFSFLESYKDFMLLTLLHLPLWITVSLFAISFSKDFPSRSQ